tara:strand:+ start:537 stop:1127 length:591 start_codon:yes stop_codon:yes gene_type:complete
MLEKEKFYKLNFLKTISIILIIILLNSNSFSSPKEEIIINLNKTSNFSFDFIQKIKDEIEIGYCQIKYPRLIHCLYNNKKKKEIISTGKSLIIRNNRDNKFYIYPLKSTPLYYILDKDYLIKQIQNLEKIKISNDIFELNFTKQNNLIIVYFDRKSFDLKGWKTIDVYQNEVLFEVNNVEKNLIIDPKIFDLPNLD